MAPFVTLQRASIEPAFSPSLAAQVVLDCTCPAFWCSRNYGNSSWSVRSFNASHLEHCTALLHKCSFLPHFLIAQAIIPILIDNLMTQRVPMHTAGIFFFSEWAAKAIVSANLPESQPPFMLCLQSSGKMHRKGKNHILHSYISPPGCMWHGYSCILLFIKC